MYEYRYTLMGGVPVRAPRFCWRIDGRRLGNGEVGWVRLEEATVEGAAGQAAGWRILAWKPRFWNQFGGCCRYRLRVNWENEPGSRVVHGIRPDPVTKSWFSSQKTDPGLLNALCEHLVKIGVASGARWGAGR